MKFINNSEEPIKVKKEPHGNKEENLPPVFVTIKPGECINANSDAFINGYKKDKLIPVKGPLEKVFEKAELKVGPEYQERKAVKGPVGKIIDKVMGTEEPKAVSHDHSGEGTKAASHEHDGEEKELPKEKKEEPEEAPKAQVKNKKK